MSDLQRTFIKPKLPNFPPPDFNEADEEEGTDAAPELPETPLDDDSSSASSASSTGTVIPSSNQKLFARPQGLVIFL
jgi:protein phosphatase methylesterase 1